MSRQLADILVQDERGRYLRCSNCGMETDVYNPQKIRVFVCPGCRTVYGSMIQFRDSGKKRNKNKKDKFIIPLHSRCTFDRDYTVIGRALKHEKDDVTASWQEYTLIDDNGSYVFLSVSYGHWILLHPCECPPEFDVRKDVFISGSDELTYTLYSSYYQITITADGEFPYDVADVKKRLSKEYIHPPHIFTCEKWKKEQTFFQGRYIQPAQIAKAFSPNVFPMPFKEGVGSCQPFYLGINHRNFNILSLIFFLLTLPVYVVLAMGHTGRNLTHLTGNVPDSVRSAEFVSSSFEISGLRPSGIQVDCKSNVINDWAEGQLVLVNEQTGMEQSCTVGIEYYHGIADGETWVESSNPSPVYFDQVEPGVYHFEMTVFASDRLHKWPDIIFSMSAVSYNSTSWNYWILMGPLLVLNIIIAIAGDRFEKLRFGLINDGENGEDE